MRALLPAGPDVRDPVTAGRTYTVVAGLLAAVYVFLATAWQTDWSIGVVPAAIASSSVAAVVVWRWFVPAEEELSNGRAAACGALVGVLAHFFAGPFYVVFVFAIRYVYELLLLENLLGSGLSFWLERSWSAVPAATLYSVVGIIPTAGVPVLVAIVTALVLANRQQRVER